MRTSALFLSLVLGLTAPALRAQNDDLAESFRQALFEEEGNRDFEKAIAAYEQVVEGYQTHRQMAASAVFRLAECHRKLDHKEEAARYYRQLLADFPAEETLAKLARENLAAMGEAAPAEAAGAPVKDPGISAEEQAELERIQRLLADSPDLVLGAHPKDLNNAAANGYLKVAELLLSKGLDVNETGDEMSPLTVAAREGRLSMVNFLLEQGADIETTADGENTPLVEAISANRAAVAKSLLERGANPAAAISRGYDALAMASAVGNPEIVGWLIEAGVDVNVSVRKGETPLSIAIVSSSDNADPMKVARQLVDAGADPNGGDVLHKVVERPDFDHPDRALAAAELLLEAGADVNRKDNRGATPLLVALTGRDGKKDSNSLPGTELFTLLLDHGADPLLANDEGKTAVDEAIARGALDLLNLFKERGVDLKKAVTGDLGAALVAACIKGDAALAQWLLEAGADPNAKDGNHSCLYYAVGSGDPVMLRQLLNAGAKPDAFGSYPPIFRTVWTLYGKESEGKVTREIARGPEANIEMLQVLLDAGADPNIRDSTGRTVLHLLLEDGRSERPGDTEIAALLLKSGADPRIADNQGRRPVDLLDPNVRAMPAVFAPPAVYAPIWEATYYEDPARPEGIWASIPSQQFGNIFSAKRGGTSTLRLSDFLLASMSNNRVPPIAEPWAYRILRHASGETERIDMAAWADGKIEDPSLAWGDIVEMAHGPGAPLAWKDVDPEAGERTRILVERLRKKLTLQLHGRTLEYTSVPPIQTLDRPFIDPTRREVVATLLEYVVHRLRHIDPTISPRFRVENAEAGSSVTLDLSEKSDGTPLLAGDVLILEAPGFEDPALAAATAGVITISREEDGFLAVIRPDTFPVTLPEMLAEAFRLHALSHPDLERIVVIRNPVPDGPGDLEAAATDAPAPETPVPTRLGLSLSQIMAAMGDGILVKDIPGFMLQAGDRIEIPALPDAEHDWTGLDEEVASFLQIMARAEVTISVLGAADRKVLLAPRFPVYESRFGLATLTGTRSPLGAAVDAGSLWLAEALHELGYPADKFDFRKVELRGKGGPRFFDLTQQAQPPVWLRDGDRLGFLARDAAAQPQSPQRRRVIIPPGG